MHRSQIISNPSSSIIPLFCFYILKILTATLSDAITYRSKLYNPSIFLKCPTKYHQPLAFHIHHRQSLWPSLSHGNPSWTRIDLSSKAYPYFDQDDYIFFKLIGVSDNSDLREMAEAFQLALEKSTNPIEKMKLKDQWYDINQKILHHNIQEFEESQISKILNFLPWKKRKRLEHNLISEFSETFLASSELPEEMIKKVRSLGVQTTPLKEWNFSHIIEGGIFQFSSLQRTFSILSYMAPILILGGISPKLSSPSIALTSLISAGLISSRDEIKPFQALSSNNSRKPPNLKTLFLTMIILSLHGAIGLITGSFFINYFNIKPNQENVMSLFLNAQFIFAALNYKTYIKEEIVEIKNNQEFDENSRENFSISN